MTHYPEIQRRAAAMVLTPSPLLSRVEQPRLALPPNRRRRDVPWGVLAVGGLVLSALGVLCAVLGVGP